MTERSPPLSARVGVAALSLGLIAVAVFVSARTEGALVSTTDDVLAVPSPSPTATPTPKPTPTLKPTPTPTRRPTTPTPTLRDEEPAPAKEAKPVEKEAEEPSGTGTDNAPETDDPPPTTGFPNTAEQRLLSHVPSAIRASCVRGYETANAEASVHCTTSDKHTGVQYSQFPSIDTMRAHYTTRYQAVGDPPDGDCSTDRYAEGPYTDPQGHPGRLMCYLDSSDYAWAEWTSERLRIYAWAGRDDYRDDLLYEWWRTSAGPY